MSTAKRKLVWLNRRVAAHGPYLVLCLTEDAYKRVMAHAKVTGYGPWISNTHSQATTHQLENPDHGLICCVCVRAWEGRDPVEVAGLLVHEAVHVWQAYAQNIGERTPGEEQEAYAIQGIAQELMAEFARQMAEGVV
ncbi:MAG: hypothetical protein WCZ20_05310 [Hydrogenophaga sp.]